MTEHVDVLIVGAGLSGIGAAARLKRELPGKSFAILESRDRVGGTWSLFHYPGVRSDSDMYTLGYSFRPWKGAKAIADGASIREYIEATVRDEGLEPAIRYRHRVVSADWSSATATWTVTVRITDGTDASTGESQGSEDVTLTCSFLSVCSGYYRYDQGFTPAIPGSDSFDGRLVHPQHWPDDLDYAGKNVVIIGSGATAVTLVPSMAGTAKHVTMLQRSPTYISPVPARDHLADRLRGRLPEQLSYDIVRAKNIGWSMFTYQLARRRPETMKGILRKSAVAKLPAGFPVETHLAPTYEPWDQRLCAIPNGDLYRAISAGTASIATDRILRIVPSGIELESGAMLDADVIVTATGLKLLVMGGMTLSIDGSPVDVSKAITYKGMMLAGVPNFSLTIGYTNASWTLKADLVASYVIRLLKRMDRTGDDWVMPVASDEVSRGELGSLIDLQAGYILRDADALPRQGEKSPWRLHQNYVRDFGLLRAGSLTNDVRFGRRGVVDPLSLPGTAYVEADGLRLRYRRTGSGPAVLLLHGIGQSLEDWNEQHDLLSSAHTVISVDLPGFGWSARGAGRSTLAGLAAPLAAFLDAIAIDGPVPVMGNSLGGAVAMTFATAHPSRVSSLVLADSAGFGSSVALVLRLISLKPVAAVLMKPKLANSKQTVAAIFYDKSSASTARVAHSFALSQRPAHQRTLREIAGELGTIRGVSPEWRHDLLARLAPLGIPTLLLWGDHDHVLPFSHLTAAEWALPDAESHVFEKTGHMPQIEKADEFARVVGEFLDRSGQRASVASGHAADLADRTGAPRS